MDEQVNAALLGACGLLLVSLVAVRVAARTGLPVLLLYLALGVAIGEAGLGVRFEDYQLTADVGFVALALVLAEGGLTTRWSAVRAVAAPTALLATAGVAVSVGVTAAAAHVLLDVAWPLAVVLGAAVSSTDAAAVFSVLRRLPLRPRIATVLEGESGLNDAPVLVLVSVAASDAWGSAPWWEVAGLVGFELAVGAVVGVAVGLAGRQLLSRAALPAAGLYPLAALALALGAFSGANALHGSGFLAVYLGALALGSARLPHHRAVLGFASSVSLLAEVALFVLLGLLASPSRLPGAFWSALLIGAVATLLGRPLGVLLATTPFGFRWREQVFLSWAGLRGAVPVVVAVVAVNEGLPGAERVVDVVFVLVVLFTLIQAPTLPALAQRLGVTEPGRATALQVENAPLDGMRADLLQVVVPPGSRLHGTYVDELRLPRGAQLSLVVRGDEALVPDQGMRLMTGDALLVVAKDDVRDVAEERLRAVSEAGKLAGWLSPAPPPRAARALAPEVAPRRRGRRG